MTEIRCKKCNRLLMVAEVAIIEVKCPKCGYLNNIAYADTEGMIREKTTSKTYNFILPLKLNSSGGMAEITVSI